MSLSNSKYKEAIIDSMGMLADDPKCVFLGEGLVEDNAIYGTMIKVPLTKVIEMPVAENLIVGSAIGLSIAGYKPVVIFQRMDFMLCGADAIINHLALISKISGGKCNPQVLIRCVLGAQDKTKFDVGLQHSKDMSHIFDQYLPARVSKRVG